MIQPTLEAEDIKQNLRHILDDICDGNNAIMNYIYTLQQEIDILTTECNRLEARIKTIEEKSSITRE